MSRLLFLLLFLGSSVLLPGQTTELKFGKVSQAEWDMDICEFDSTAAAVILMEQCFIHFSGDKAYLRIHKRIKILDEKGFDYGNLIIPYYHHDRREYISGFKGMTLIKGPKGKVRKIQAGETFKEKINEFWSEYKVPFPAIQTGAVLEYKYEFVTENLLTLEPWEFQHEIPTVYSALSVQLPSYLKYNILGFGNHYGKKYDSKDRKEWVLERLPGYKDEDFVYNPKDYIDQVRFQAHSVYTQVGWENILQDWDELGKEMMSKHYVRVFNRANRRKDLLTGLMAPGDSEKEKILKIFDFVRSNYSWNGYYSIYPNRNYSEFLEKLSGNITDINLLLIGLLRSQGITADPVLISSRSNGKPINNFPLLSQFNLVICAVETAGQLLLLDAVPRDGILPFDHLPLEDLNHKGLRVKTNGTEWVAIPFSDHSRSQALLEMDFSSGEGNMKLRFKGYPAAEKRFELIQGKDIFDKVVFESFSGDEIHIKQTEITNMEKLEESLEVDYELDLVDISDLDLLYFNPSIWTNWKQSPFNKAERTLPVELPYPFTDQVAIKISLPEGYALEEAPEDMRIALPQNLGVFSYNIRQATDHILINMQLKISGVYMVPETYFYLKDFFDQISQKVNEVLVFGKVD